MDARCLRDKIEENQAVGYELMKRFVPVLVERLHGTRLQALDLYAGRLAAMEQPLMPQPLMPQPLMPQPTRVLSARRHEAGTVWTLEIEPPAGLPAGGLRGRAVQHGSTSSASARRRSASAARRANPVR